MVKYVFSPGSQSSIKDRELTCTFYLSVWLLWVLPLIILHQLKRILNEKQIYQINVVINIALNMFLMHGN